ncbi:hypothetical protein YM304_20000 [Ilumatobacter coccineus YM16-304]|uniref:Uncharacterized protein n=1 Tax=Ilumatobacter coccineus (strain NBRC 103263 / KCTC 29153 / YM16-304) TaxID=1313172 RepID=A0A6C7E2Q0_ILUCY|nr:hypothetical protein YM304_20000 [Ilumatobacter coccineus YM16-304]
MAADPSGSRVQSVESTESGVTNRLTVVAPGRSESSHRCCTRPFRIVSPLPHRTIPNRLTTATPDDPESSHHCHTGPSRIVSRLGVSDVTNRLTVETSERDESSHHGCEAALRVLVAALRGGTPGHPVRGLARDVRPALIRSGSGSPPAASTT